MAICNVFVTPSNKSLSSDVKPKSPRASDLPDGTNVNHTLVKDGWCWWYRKYALGDTVLEGLEAGRTFEKLFPTRLR